MATTMTPEARGGRAGAATGKALVLYDGECPLCRRSVELLRRLDWFEWLTYLDVRDPDHLAAAGVTADTDRLLREMHLVTPDGSQVYSGFGAFRWLAWRLPLLWVIAPLLHLPGAEAVGQKLYQWVARNRFRLVPCNGGVCSVRH